MLRRSSQQRSRAAMMRLRTAELVTFLGCRCTAQRTREVVQLGLGHSGRCNRTAGLLLLIGCLDKEMQTGERSPQSLVTSRLDHTAASPCSCTDSPANLLFQRRMRPVVYHKGLIVQARGAVRRLAAAVCSQCNAGGRCAASGQLQRMPSSESFCDSSKTTPSTPPSAHTIETLAYFSFTSLEPRITPLLDTGSSTGSPPATAYGTQSGLRQA